MKPTINLSKLLLFVIISFGFAINAVAAPSQKNDIAWGSVASGKPGSKNISCSIKFADLNYVGIQFEGEAICVEAKNDAEASVNCRGMKRWINPGNPQYQSSIKGTRGSNPEGYFYCVSGALENDKMYACEKIAPTKSIYNSQGKDYQIVFKWDKTSNKDGDCLCGMKGAPNLGFQECDRDAPRFPDLCAKIKLPKASYEEIMAMTDETDRANAQCGAMACKCADGRIFPSATAETKCKEEPPPKKASGVAEATPTTPRPPPQDTLDENLKLCVDNWKESANKCKTTSDEAKKGCRSDDKSGADTAKVIDAASKSYINSKSGTGAQQECFTGGLVANYAKDLLNKKSDECATKTDSCKEVCKVEEINKEKDRCYTILRGVIESRYGGGDVPDNKNSQYFTEGERLANDLITQGQTVCGEVEKTDKGMISDALSSVGKSLASSMTCMCKLSSGGTGPCDQIAPPSSCETNPNLPGCRQYGSLNVCTPGASYDAKLCSCQLNPKGAGCPGGDLSGGLSNFATGGDIQSSTGTADIGTPISDLKAGPTDLDSMTPEATEAGKLTLEPTKTGANAGGPGGGVGGGSSSGGAGEPSGGAPDEEEKSGIRGLFGAAKSFMSNAFGGKKTKGNGDVAGSKNGKFDPNKFRPIRGVASKTGVGSKNQDIWKMVNTCLYSETCASNSNSFLESPLKHK